MGSRYACDEITQSDTQTFKSTRAKLRMYVEILLKSVKLRTDCKNKHHMTSYARAGLPKREFVSQLKANYHLNNEM